MQHRTAGRKLRKDAGTSPTGPRREKPLRHSPGTHPGWRSPPKGIEQRKRLGGGDVIEVPAELNGVVPPTLGHVIQELVATLFIEIRIAAVHAQGKQVGNFQVRL